MPTEQIISLLVAERDRLNRAIEALRGGVSRAGRPSKSSDGAAPTASISRRRRRKPMSAAQKKAHSERMKAFWAERRKAKKA